MPIQSSFAVVLASLSLLLFTAVSPAVAAVELTVVDPLTPIYGPGDVEPDGSVLRLVAPRGGVGSAQVVATGTDLARLDVTLSPLKQGSQALPSDAVAVRFAGIESGYELDVKGDRKNHRFLDAYHDRLHATIPSDIEDVLPIWLTVSVPADTAPGVYRGELRAGGQRVPVELTVSAWLCPPPPRWTTHVGAAPSHEVLAKQYGVPYWSKAHWKLIDEELRLLGGIGGDDLWLHMLADFGFGEGLAQLRFKRVNGRLVPDFSILDRYIDLHAERVGRPQWVLIHLWSGPSRDRRGRVSRTVDVFVDGEQVGVPRPEMEGGEAIWRPVIEHIHARITEHHGWDERSILFALAGDQRPAEQTVQTLREWAPYARWMIWTHGRGDPSRLEFGEGEPIVLNANGMEIAAYITPFTPSLPPKRHHADEAESTIAGPGIQGGWDLRHAEYTTCRSDLHKYHLPSQYRGYANGNTVGVQAELTKAGPTIPQRRRGIRGFAFLWFDFWPQNGHQPYFSRWCNSLTRQNTPSLIAPGPDGPLATVRYEQLREGLQETEARVAVERAILAGRLSDRLEAEARDHLQEMMRLRFNLGTDREFSGGHAGSRLGNPSHTWGFAEYPRWMALTARLYDLAAQAQTATGGR